MLLHRSFPQWKNSSCKKQSIFDWFFLFFRFIATSLQQYFLQKHLLIKFSLLITFSPLIKSLIRITILFEQSFQTSI